MSRMGSWTQCRCCDGKGEHWEIFAKRKPDGRYRESHECTCCLRGTVATEPLLGFPKATNDDEYQKAQMEYVNSKKCRWHGYPTSW